MKILQINAVYKHLSTGSNVYEMNAFLRRKGHQALAAYSVGTVEVPEQEYLIGSLPGQKLHALLSRMTGLQGYFSSFSTRRLLRYMDEITPDVVVLNNLHANYIHLPMLLKYLAKKDIPTVAVLHDCWFYTGKCCYYTVAGCEKWKTGCKNCPAKKQYNKSWFFDRTPKMFQDRKKLFSSIPRLGVVAVSDWLLEQAKQSPVFDNAKKIKRIHNWIDASVFAPADSSELRKKWQLQDKKVLLSVAAAWETRKGLDTLLWIARRLQPEEVMILIGTLGNGVVLPDNVIHIPRTDSRDELVAYYSMADVFLQPSLEETFGKVTAEAIACGTPVVCYDSTANPELVGPGCGGVVSAGDREGMLLQAREILKNGKTAYTRFCRSFAEDMFDTDRIFEQYLQMFLQIQSSKDKAVEGVTE